MEIAVASIAESLCVFFGAALEVLVRTHEVLGLEISNRVLNFALGEVHYRAAGRFLVAGVGQRIERQRVLIRRHYGLFDQATDDADFLFVELWQHIESSVICPDSARCTLWRKGAQQASYRSADLPPARLLLLLRRSPRWPRNSKTRPPCSTRRSAWSWKTPCAGRSSNSRPRIRAT